MTVLSRILIKVKVKESAEVEATEKVKVTDESLLNDSIGATTLREASTAVVYATTAAFKNSPFSQLTRNNMNSLSDIIDSKEHLHRNIEDFKFGNVSTWKAENQKFDHQMQVIFKVKTVRSGKAQGAIYGNTYMDTS